MRKNKRGVITISAEAQCFTVVYLFVDNIKALF